VDLFLYYFSLYFIKKTSFKGIFSGKKLLRLSFYIIDLVKTKVQGTPKLFRFLKSSVRKLQLFMWKRSWCKMGSPDLQEFTAASM
jgi:hypothetical protein